MEIRIIGVVGAGQMGSGIAEVDAGYMGVKTGRGFYQYGGKK